MREDRRRAHPRPNGSRLQCALGSGLGHEKGRIAALKVVVQVNDEREPRPGAAAIGVVDVLIAAVAGRPHAARGPGAIQVLAVGVALFIPVDAPASVEATELRAPDLLGQELPHAGKERLVLLFAGEQDDIVGALVHRRAQRHVRPVADGFGQCHHRGALGRRKNVGQREGTLDAGERVPLAGARGRRLEGEHALPAAVDVQVEVVRRHPLQPRLVRDDRPAARPEGRGGRGLRLCRLAPALGDERGHPVDGRHLRLDLDPALALDYDGFGARGGRRWRWLLRGGGLIRQVSPPRRDLLEGAFRRRGAGIDGEASCHAQNGIEHHQLLLFAVRRVDLADPALVRSELGPLARLAPPHLPQQPRGLGPPRALRQGARHAIGRRGLLLADVGLHKWMQGGPQRLARLRKQGIGMPRQPCCRSHHLPQLLPFEGRPNHRQR
mmetsp:Transcript_93392/g.237741  ORF Transcript_93392/g.237741 Transcript_93392/m.237741 type:complete len:438 (-) Transcript_93392:399-1712(-)